MDTVEVKLLKYAFRFRKLAWREEFAIKFEPKESKLRTVLAHALVEVSGFPINTVDDAKRVLTPIPSSIIDRVFIIYKGSLRSARSFSTMGLYRAPEPKKFTKKVKEVERERDKIMDKVEGEIERKFGRQAIMEAREVENQMLKRNHRGLTKATPEKK